MCMGDGNLVLQGSSYELGDYDILIELDVLCSCDGGISCRECGGSGYALTPDGEVLLKFLRRHVFRATPVAEFKSLRGE